MKEIIDPTGTPLHPSWQGKRCKGNGENQEYECCCDECDYFCNAFPSMTGGSKACEKS